MIKLLDFFSNLLDKFIEYNCRASSHEAYVIIAMLFNRLSNSNSLIKNKAKALMKQAFLICNSAKIISIVADVITLSKNMKSIALCLEELAILIDRDGANGVNEKLFKQLFKYVEHSDSGARRATFTLIEKTYEN